MKDKPTLSLAMLWALAWVAYQNSFSGAFVLDDIFHIVGDATIRDSGRPLKAMFGGMNHTRPLVGFTFWLNHSISGLSPGSYHLLNLLVHFAGSLALFGIVRRTLSTKTLKEKFGSAASRLALAISAIWLVHPLQTESVTYITQRFESIMGMFFLLTVYFFIRSLEQPNRSVLSVATLLTSLMAAASKQTAVIIPPLLLLYDRTFFSGTFAKAFKSRSAFYLSLLLTWALIGILQSTAPPQEWAGFEVAGLNSWEYARSQFGVLLHYLYLSIWPFSLCLDYGWPVADSPGQIIPQAFAILSLLGVTVWAVLRNRPEGVAGGAFFLLLAPTSSIMPIADLAVEHRMYLPLVPLTSLGVLFGYGSLQKALPPRFASKAGTWITLLIVFGLTGLTLNRNSVYQSDVTVWKDVVSKRPKHVRAYINLSASLLDKNELEEATFYLKEALRLDPKNAGAHSNLGSVALKKGDSESAITHFRTAVQLEPSALSHYNLGYALQLNGKKQEALEQYRASLLREPSWPPPMLRMAWILSTHEDSRLRAPQEAIRLAEAACRLNQYQHPVFLNTLAAALANGSRFNEAIKYQEKALNLIQATGNPQLISLFSERLKLYQHNRHVREKEKAISLDLLLPIPR